MRSRAGFRNTMTLDFPPMESRQIVVIVDEGGLIFWADDYDWTRPGDLPRDHWRAGTK